MIKNLEGLLAVGFAALVGCEQSAELPAGWQGVVEFEERTLAFELPGRLAEVTVDEGDDVAPGAVLARIDDTLETLARDAKAAEARAVKAELELIEAGTRPEDIVSAKAALRAANAELDLAERTLERERDLDAKGVGVPASFDAAQTSEAAAAARKKELEATLRRLRRGARDEEIAGAAARLDAAEAAVALGDARIARYVLRTEGAGEVLQVHVEPDEVVQSGAPVATLADVTHPFVDVFVPQGSLGDIQLGTAMQVRVDAHDDPYAGTVEFIGRRTEFTPRFLFSERERPNLVVRVRIRIDAPEGDLHSGVPAFAVVAGAGE